MPKRIGVSTSLFASPLFSRLRPPGPCGPFLVSADVPAALAIKLREKSLDAAFLSPIDYAREYQMYGIMSDCCAAAGAGAPGAVIMFRDQLRSVRSLAVSPASASEIILADLIFREQFGGPPSLIPFLGTPEDGLAKADGVLCVGDDALRIRNEGRPLFDLTGEWVAGTDLPFVHGIWVSRPEALTGAEIRFLGESRDEGVAAIPADSAHGPYLSTFTYTLDDSATASLSEFFRLAYYHGILADLPDLRLLFRDSTAAPAVN